MGEQCLNTTLKGNALPKKKVKISKRNKKVKIIEKNKKQTYTLEHKNLNRQLKKEGKEPHEIRKLFMEKYEVEVRPSTLATWYNKSNMERHEQRVHTNTSMASVETHVNPSQRPTILIDMECALVQQVEKSNNSGTVPTKKTLKEMGQCIFNKLRASKIYDDSGERLQALSEDGLLDYIRDNHVPDAEVPPPRGNEKVYIFNASNGWARNFLKRHKIHSVPTQESPSAASASPSAASPSAALPSASPSAAADMEDESNSSDVLSNAAAAAVAASAATDFLNVSTTSSTISTIRYEVGGEEFEICKFTPLTGGEPSMTSSPRPGCTGSGRRYSTSPSPRRRTSRRVKQAEYSSGDITTSGDEVQR